MVSLDSSLVDDLPRCWHHAHVSALRLRLPAVQALAYHQGTADCLPDLLRRSANAGLTDLRLYLPSAQALAYIQDTADCLPDLVLLDVMMPTMSGYEVCRPRPPLDADTCLFWDWS